MSRKNNSTKANKPSDKTMIYVALISLMGTIIVAVISVLNTRTQILLPVSLTQTFAPKITTPTQPTFNVTTAPNTPLPAVASPQALTAPLVTTQKIACIIDQQESGTSAKVSAESLFYSSTALGRIQELPLISGQKIPFNSIKSFEVVEIHEKTIGGVKVAITLLTGDIIVGVVASSQYEGSSLVGTTDYGSFELRFLDLKRVEFREEGNCQ
jgi:hypothetical protein